MRKILAVLALSISATAVAYAQPGHTTRTQQTWSQSDLKMLDSWLDRYGDRFEDWFYDTWGPVIGITDPDSHSSSSSSGSTGGTVAAPELDPAMALAALTLLSGGLAVLRGRRSKR